MNWKAIKYIYYYILSRNYSIEYLGEDKYKITSWRKNEQKYYEIERKNEVIHGKYIGWWENGQKRWEYEYKNGKPHGKHMGWSRDGNKDWEEEYKNGRLI